MRKRDLGVVLRDDEGEIMTLRVNNGEGLAPRAQHILIVFLDFAMGGTELIALKLAREWVKAGRRVTILCGTYEGSLWGDVPKGVEVICVAPEIGTSLFSRLKLRRVLSPYIDKIAPDVVFLQGNYYIVLAGAIAKSQHRPPVAVKISNPISPAGSVSPMRWVTNRAYAHSARHVDWLVAMSSGLMVEANRVTGSDRVSVIFDPNVEGNGLPAKARRPLEPNDHIRLLAAGRLAAQKDFALALRVTAALARTRDVHLTILGEGEKRGSLERLAQSLGIADRVSMPGHAPSIIPALADADALLVTSIYEGGPAVAVEALAQGVPVISTDCSHFLHDVLAAPGSGQIVASRDPEALAVAVEAVLSRANGQTLDPVSATAAYRTDTASTAYLALFDRLVSERLSAPV